MDGVGWGVRDAALLGLVGVVLMLIPYYVNIVGLVLVLVALYMLARLMVTTIFGDTHYTR